MRVIGAGVFASAIVCAVLAGPVAPAAAQQRQDSARIAELERQMEAVTREMERMRLGREVVRADTSVHRLGPAASKVYRVDSGVSIGGYGEALYQNFSGARQDGTEVDAPSRWDAYRAILYAGYKYNDRLLFNSEIEVEHADEIELEFAYVDYLLTPTIGVRGGLLLAPVGLVNELHEPPTFLGTTRPLTETVIIPTTWRENGVGLFGHGGVLDWRVYVMTGLDARGLSASGLRDARQEGSRAVAEDLSFVGRLDWVGRPDLVLGGSAYYGKTAQGHDLGPDVAGGLLLWDVHADYQAAGLQLRALVAGTRLNDVIAVNDALGLDGTDAVAEGMRGWYVQAGYDVLRRAATDHQLIPYLRYESLDTQAEVAEGFAADPALDRSVLSIGVAWKPVPQVVTKLDWQRHDNGADTGLSQWNVQLGWLF